LIFQVTNKSITIFRYIDKFEAHLEACGGLGYLYFERASFFSALGMTLKHVSQSQFVSAFISIPENFLSNVNSFYPKEVIISSLFTLFSFF